MTKKKPKWGQPKLVVLAKDKYGESVLLNCKDWAVGYETAPYAWDASCTKEKVGTGCVACFSITAS